MTKQKEPAVTSPSSSLFATSPNNNSNFESCGGTLCELDDGHVPETFSTKGTWIHYPEMDTLPAQVFVYDNVLPTSIVNELYQKTISEGQPWGSYVTMDQVVNYWNKQQQEQQQQQQQQQQSPTTCTTTTTAHHHQQQQCPLVVAAGFFLQTIFPDATTTSTTPTPTAQIQLPPCEFAGDEALPPPQSQPPVSLPQMDSKIHGVAMWALASSSDHGQEVHYHVDYAELIRYEFNVMAIPLWAGTLQCTCCSKMDGGEFAVNLQGLQHYQRYGYKGILGPQNNDDNSSSSSSRGGWSRPPSHDNHHNSYDEPTVHYNKETGWVTIPYKYNRMIRHSGPLPHLSASFTGTTRTSGGGDATRTQNNHVRRVIVGFNVFRTDVGPLVQEAPEHSPAFRRRIQYQRMWMAWNNNDKSNRRLTWSNVYHNKTLGKLLVLAKRQKVQQAWKEAQDTLDRELERVVVVKSPTPTPTSSNRTTKKDTQPPQEDGGGTLVQTLMDTLQTLTPDGEWPFCGVDVQVHIQRRVQEGKFICNTRQVTPESVIYKRK